MDTNSESPSRASNEKPIAPKPKFRPLRVWPAFVLAIIMLVTRFGPALLEGGASKYWMIVVIGPLLCCLLILIWWLTASRATWRERVFGFLGLVAAAVAVVSMIHPSMVGPGIMSVMVPMGLLIFVVGVWILRDHRPLKRTGIAVSLALIGFCFSLLLRNEGMTGDYVLVLHWRWTPTPEDLMLAKSDTTSAAAVQHEDSEDTEATFSNPEWSAFRGSDRTGTQRGPVIATDWDTNPPELVWKIPVGPGWGSFAVAGNYLFTMEQRGPMECVVCYDANTGTEIWAQQSETRFDEPMGGPGPRTTPTLSDGKLFVTGATGNVMRLDPATGDVVWKQELQKIADRKPPTWAFSASPLVVEDVAIVHAGGVDDKGIVAFDVETGELAWSAASGDHTYASPQLNTISDEESVVMLSNSGVDLLDPQTGTMRLHYEWPISNYRALQPKVINGNTILIPTGMNKGTRAVRVKNDGANYSAEELWTSRNMKPDFSDFVIFEGNAYGFDGGIFASMDLETGDRNWKGGRYGKGQVLLLENSRALLVASERGDAVLLKADPAKEVVLGSFKALEAKTWNHPVAVSDRLYIRNAQEAACYRLPLLAADDIEKKAHTE